MHASRIGDRAVFDAAGRVFGAQNAFEQHPFAEHIVHDDIFELEIPALFHAAHVHARLTVVKAAVLNGDVAVILH